MLHPQLTRYKRILIVLLLLVWSVPLTPYLVYSFGSFNWQRYAGVYTGCALTAVYTGRIEATTWRFDDFNFNDQTILSARIEAGRSEPGLMMLGVYGWNPEAGVSESLGMYWTEPPILYEQTFDPPVYQTLQVALDPLAGGVMAYYDYEFVVCRTPTIELSPLSQSGSALPGGSVVYDLTLTNHTMAPDQFLVVVDSTPWPTTITYNGDEFSLTPWLEDGESFTFQVTVQVPFDVTTPEARLTAVGAGSISDPLIFAMATMETYPNLFAGVQLQPGVSSGQALPGNSFVYDVTIENTGNLPDTYMLSSLGGSWAANYPLEVGPLAPGEQFTFQVAVSIPPQVPGGVQDEFTLQAVSGIDPGTYATAQLFTTAQAVYGLAVTPQADQRTLLPGDSDGYTLWITNTGNITDTYTALLLPPGGAWLTSTFPLTLGPLGPGQAAAVQLPVSVPANVNGDTADEALVQFSSQIEASAAASVTLTTLAQPLYGLQLAPLTAAGAGDPGSQVDYQLTLTNTSNLTVPVLLEVDSQWLVWSSNLGLLGRGEVRPLTISIPVPPNAPAGAWDLAEVNATELKTWTATAQALLTTTANAVYGLQVAPLSQQGAGEPGTLVTYTLSVTNTGNITDSLSIQVLERGWLSGAFPVQVGPLGAGQSSLVQIQALVPAAAPGGTLNQARLLVSSQGNVLQSQEVLLNTTSNPAWSFALAPLAEVRQDLPGATVDYRLEVTNTGNMSDSYQLALSSGSWPANAPLNLGPLQINESAAITVSVAIPAGVGGGEQDVLTVTLSSSTHSAIQSSSVLTTVASISYGVGLYVRDPDKILLPCESVQYLVTVTNRSNTTESFDVVLQDAQWQTEAPPTVGPLAPGQSRRFYVTVYSPCQAAEGQSDTVNLSVIAQSDPGAVASIALTTTIKHLVWPVFIPFVAR